jgi:hypothetical protein
VRVLAHEGPAEVGIVVRAVEFCRPEGRHIGIILFAASQGPGAGSREEGGGHGFARKVADLI